MYYWIRVVAVEPPMSEAAKTDYEVFDAVQAIDDLEERNQALERECAGNPKQLARLQALLHAWEEADGFMETRDHIPGTTRKPVATPILGIGETPGSVIGNYKLLQEIGAGGFGVVYMAEQQKPIKRKVALKIIKPGMDTREVVARFEAERQALALMSHPNIAQVFDGGATESGRPFFVMELVKGIPITEFCDKSKLTTKRRLGLFLDICSAIQHAHQKGVIHRDIKPSNVLITLHDGVPVPKVIDFGIAKALDQELTEKSLFTAYGQMIGTPQYTSPEQAEMSGLDIDTRTDIYSLGVLLYELLTGATPISRQELSKAGIQEVQKLIKEKEPTKPSMALSIICRETTTVAESRRQDPGQLIDQIKGDLDWIVLKALEKDRTRRYDTASEFAEDIRRCLDHQPVIASPPTATYLIGKFIRRNVRLIAAITAVFLALLIGAVGMTVLYFDARADRKTAEEKTLAATQSQIQAEAARAAEVKQRKLTQQTARQLQTSLSRADFASGVAHINRNEPRKGLSHLARSLRTDPEFKPAAQSIVATLRDRNFDMQPELTLEHRAAIRDFTLSDDGKHILTTAHDRTVRLWDADSLALKKEWGTEDPVVSADFVDAGSHVVVATVGGRISFWETVMSQTSGPAIAVPAPVRKVAASLRSPDHPVAAVLAGDQSLRMWDGRSGQPITQNLVIKDLTAGDCHLNSDGTRLLARLGERLYRYYDATTGQPIARDLMTEYSFATQISMDRESLITFGRNRTTFTSFQLATGTKLNVAIPGEQKLKLISPPVVSADQSLIICVSRPTIKVRGVIGRQIVRGSNLVTRIYDHTNGVLIAAANDARSIHDPFVHAAAGISALQIDNFSVRIRDLKTTRILVTINLRRAIAPSKPGSPNLVFSPAGDRIAIRCSNYGFAVYETLTGRLQAEGGRRELPFRTIQFSPEGQRLATTTDNGVLQIWNASSGHPLTTEFQHKVSIGKVVFDQRRARLFSLDQNKAGANSAYGVLRCWDIRESAARYPAMRLPLLSLRSVVYSDGQRSVVETKTGEILVLSNESPAPIVKLAVADKELRLASLSSFGGRVAATHGREAFVWNLNGKDSPISISLRSALRKAKLSENGRHLVTLSSKHHVRVWNTSDGTAVSASLPHAGPVLGMDVHTAAMKLVTASQKQMRIWNLKSVGSKKSTVTLVGGGGQNTTIEFSPDGTSLLTAKMGEAHIWNAKTGERLDTFTHPFVLKSAHFSPDGRQIVVTGPDSDDRVPGVALIWNIASHKQIAELAHENPVLEAFFDERSEQIVTKDNQGTLRLWHLETGQCLAPPIWHRSPGKHVAFAIGSGGRELLCMSNGKLRTWSMPVPQSTIPGWLVPLAESVAGLRLDEEGNSAIVPRSELLLGLKRLTNLAGTDDFSRFGRWFAAPRTTRTVSPHSERAEDDLMEQLLGDVTADGLREALRLQPRNALAFARLAAKVKAEEPFRTKHWRSFPEWYARQAVQADPHLPEAWLSQADVLERRGKYVDCLKAISELETLNGPSLESVYLKAVAIWERGDGEEAYGIFRPHLVRLHGREIKKESDAGLRYVAMKLKSSPHSGKHLSALAVQFAQVSGNPRISRALADWVSRWAVELAPEDPIVLADRVKISKLLGQDSPTAKFIAELIRKNPKSPDAWYSLASLKYHDREYEDALKAIETSLTLQPETRGTTRRKLKLQVYEALGLATETRKLYVTMGIPPRDYPPSKELVDLSPYYNQLLNEPWPKISFGGRRLSLSNAGKPGSIYSGNFPRRHRVNGITFDIRGAITLDGTFGASLNKKTSTNLWQVPNFPARLQGIALGRKAKSLHFFHGMHGSSRAQTKRELVGSYLIHYANGEKQEFQIQLGRDVWPMLQRPDTPLQTERSKLAWTGRIPVDGPLWCFYHSEWKNPLPDVEIAHLDFTAKSKPVLLGLSCK